MVTASRLSANLSAVFDLARADGLSIKILSKERVFILDITPTNEKYVHHNLGRKHKVGNRAHPRPVMRMENCPECNYIMVAKICINRMCLTNKHKRGYKRPPELSI